MTNRVADRAASERFYAAVLSTLGINKSSSAGEFDEWDDFSVAAANERHPATRRVHIGFVAPSPAHVDEFWRAGTAAGYRDDGAPGPRPEYGVSYYGAFLLDPDGNSAEAVRHDELRRGGSVDHVWMRVADLGLAREFYELVGRHAGFRLDRDLPGRAQFAGASGSFSVLRGPPSEHAHLAFPVGEDAEVDEFHRALIAAGHRDNGAPGLRPQYHEGYYAAFVLDPDGNNIELVNHNRDSTA